MEKVALVTGASGYIGTRLVRKLLGSGYRVVAFDLRFSPAFVEEFEGKVLFADGDINDKDKICSLIEKNGVEYIYHMAGLKNRKNQIEEFSLLMHVNYGGTLSILDCARQYPQHIKHVILMGTTEEYGTAVAPFYETSQELPNSAYGLSKLAATRLALLFYTQYKVPVTIMRPSITYGPGQGTEMFLPALITGLLSDKPFAMSPGLQVRDFLYIDDLIDALVVCCEESNLCGEIVNVASGISLQLKEVAEKVACFLQKEDALQVGAIPYRGFEIMNYSINIDKIKKLSSWRPITSFEEGIKKTINSYK
jgi:UDP-glucose 4-epimerase